IELAEFKCAISLPAEVARPTPLRQDESSPRRPPPAQVTRRPSPKGCSLVTLKLRAPLYLRGLDVAARFGWTFGRWRIWSPTFHSPIRGPRTAAPFIPPHPGSERCPRRPPPPRGDRRASHEAATT